MPTALNIVPVYDDAAVPIHAHVLVEKAYSMAYFVGNYTSLKKEQPEIFDLSQPACGKVASDFGKVGGFPPGFPFPRSSATQYSILSAGL